MKALQSPLVFILAITMSVTLLTSDITNSASRDPVRARNGMVISADTIASRIGVDILKKGGNAVDAAVAVGFALAVTYPGAGNIGGGGFMVIRFADGNAVTIDYREKAPSRATRDMYLDEKGEFVSERSQIGHLSSGVPGSVAGLLLALDKFGTMKLADVIQPAIDLAENGFPMHYRLAEDMQATISEFSKFPSSMKVFTRNGEPYKEGETFVQKDLAKTLKLIRDEGCDGFYEGEVADLIVAEMERGGGLITHRDPGELSSNRQRTCSGDLSWLRNHLDGTFEFRRCGVDSTAQYHGGIRRHEAWS